MLSNVIDELVRFRTKVRHYALALPEEADAVPMEGAAAAEGAKQEQKEKRQQLIRERKPLLEACDSLRGDLAAYGIHIKVEDNDPLCELTSNFLRLFIFAHCAPSAAVGVVPCSLYNCNSRRLTLSLCLVVLLAFSSAAPQPRVSVQAVATSAVAKGVLFSH